MRHREGNHHRLIEWGQVNEHGQTQSRQHAWARKYWDKCKKRASDSKSKSRTRLNFGEKIKILGLLRDKVTYGEIARRFNCGATAIGKIAKERAALEEDHALGGRDSALKSTRGGAFPKVCFSSTAAHQLEEQEEFATALLQDSQDELMARVNKTHVVEDPSDDELDDGETVESTGEGVVARGSMPPSHETKTKQETFVLGEDVVIRDFASKPGRQADMMEFTQA